MWLCMDGCTYSMIPGSVDDITCRRPIKCRGSIKCRRLIECRSSVKSRRHPKCLSQIQSPRVIHIHTSTLADHHIVCQYFALGVTTIKGAQGKARARRAEGGCPSRLVQLSMPPSGQTKRRETTPSTTTSSQVKQAKAKHSNQTVLLTTPPPPTQPPIQPSKPSPKQKKTQPQKKKPTPKKKEKYSIFPAQLM